MEIVRSGANSGCSVKLRKSQLRLVQPADPELDENAVALPGQSHRRAEDILRRKGIHDLITKIDKGSVSTAKSIMSSSFKGENQWYSKGPLSLLTSSINMQLSIVIRVGNIKVSRITGTLLLFDRHFNLVLQDCILNNQSHKSMFIRGSLVVFISS